jgi:hypothetical protein
MKKKTKKKAPSNRLTLEQQREVEEMFASVQVENERDFTADLDNLHLVQTLVAAAESKLEVGSALRNILASARCDVGDAIAKLVADRLAIT